MSEVNPITFNYNEEDYEIEDPRSKLSWLNALKPALKEFADNNYAIQYERAYGDLSKEFERKLARAVGMAMIEHRKIAAKENENYAENESTDERTTWKQTLEHYISIAVHADLDDESSLCLAQDPQSDVLSETGFWKLRDDIENALYDEGGLDDVDVDNIFYELLNFTENEMLSNDNSDVFDAYGKISLKFMHVAFPEGLSSIDDIMFSTMSMNSIRPCTGTESLLKLFRIPCHEFFNELDIDATETAIIDSWIKEFKGDSYELTPLKTPEEVIQIIDDSSSHCMFAMWVGELTLDEILKIDPTKPFELTGGVVGLNDCVNGAYSVVDMGSDSIIVVSTDAIIMNESGYGVDEHSMAADIKNTGFKKKNTWDYDRGGLEP